MGRTGSHGKTGRSTPQFLDSDVPGDSLFLSLSVVGFPFLPFPADSLTLRLQASLLNLWAGLMTSSANALVSEQAPGIANSTDLPLSGSRCRPQQC